MKSVLLVLVILGFGLECLAQALSAQTVRQIVSEPIQCRYQLREDGYSRLMPFTLDVKIVAVGERRYLDVSLSTESRFFSALNIAVRSSAGFEPVAGSPMMRMQSAFETNVNSKAEVMGRTIKLQITDPDGRDWRSISCLRENLETLVNNSRLTAQP